MSSSHPRPATDEVTNRAAAVDADSPSHSTGEGAGEGAVKAKINAAVETAIEDCRRWVSFASVSSTSNDDVNDSIAERLRTLGFSVHVQRYVDPAGVAKSNVVARRESERPGDRGTGESDCGENNHGRGGGGEAGDADIAAAAGVAYFAHSDVVPADGWTGPPDGHADPFRMVAHEGRLYGRGTCDMKGSLAAMIAAAELVSPSRQCGPLSIVVTGDEEVGFNGAKHFAESDAMREMVRRQPLTIIGEPTQMIPVHAHKGIAAATIISDGLAGHSGTDQGINANDAMVPFLVRLRDWSRRCREEASLQNAAFDPPHLSINYGVGDGVTAVNIVPGQSRAWLSLRAMPGVDHSIIWDDLRSTADDLGLRWIDRCHGNPVWVPPDSPHMKWLQRLTGRPTQTVCYGTDGGVLDGLNRRVILGPGDIAQAHTSDEYLSLDQLRRGIATFAEILMRSKSLPAK